MLRHQRKQGYLGHDGEIVLNPTTDELFAEDGAMGQATTSSIAGRIAFGRAGK